MTQVLNSKWNGSMFTKKVKVDPTLKSLLTIPGVPERHVPIDFGGTEMGWMPTGFNNKLKKSNEFKPDVSKKPSNNSLRSIFKKPSWSRSTEKISQPIHTNPSPPISPERETPLTKGVNNPLASPEIIPFETTYSQSMYKLKMRRPLLQLLLIQHIIGRLQSTQKSLLRGPEKPNSLTWPRPTPRNIKPLIVLTPRKQPIEEDDDIPIALLKPRLISH